MKQQSQLWRKILEGLERDELSGEEFPLQCKNHPEKVVMVKCLKDFEKVPEGKNNSSNIYDICVNKQSDNENGRQFRHIKKNKGFRYNLHEDLENCAWMKLSCFFCIDVGKIIKKCILL